MVTWPPAQFDADHLDGETIFAAFDDAQETVLNALLDHVVALEAAVAANTTLIAGLDQTALAGWYQLGAVNVAVAAPTIEFSAIPATYQRLRLDTKLRTDRALTVDNVSVAFNSDTTDANYDRQYLQGEAASPTAAETPGVAGSRRINAGATGATAAGNLFARASSEIGGYAGTDFKILRSFVTWWGARTTGSLIVAEQSIGWASAAAINEITLTPQNGTVFAVGSTANLYGLKVGG